MTKKILIFINHLKMGGGASRSAAFLGSKLHNKSYDVYYLSISHYLPMYEVKGQYFALNQDFESFSKIKKFKFLIFDIPKILKDFSNKHNIEQIISFGWTSNFPSLISRIFFKSKSKLIIAIRGNPNLQHTKSYGILRLLKYFLFKIIIIKYLLKKADMVITQTKDIEIMLYRYGINKKKVKTINNFYDINFQLKLSRQKISSKYDDIFNDSFVYINIGRYIISKGLDHLIKSFKNVVDKYEKAKLIILGDGNLKNDLKKLVKALNLEKHVFFIGIHSNIFPFLKKSNCFIFTSLWEGFPNVLVEALSMNLPVISTDCRYGPREILCPEVKVSEKIEYPYYGKYGILIEPFKFETNFNNLKFFEKEKILSKLMIKIIEDPEIKNKYSNGLKRAKDFDERKKIPDWEEIIKQF